MFHVDCTFEDMRIIANSTDGELYNTSFYDSLTGESKHVTITSLQLSYIFAINMDNAGEPEGYEKMYESLEPLFVGWPNTVRPIP